MLARLTLLFSIIVIAFPARAQWQPNGVPLNGGGTPQLATDGSGGALVTWGYWDPWTGQWNYAMAQGVSAAGNTRWQPGGKILCQPSDNFGPQVVSDGNGGAIFVFLDNRSGYVDIYAQRIDWSGAELWPSCGVPVRVLPIDIAPYQNIAAVPDNSGGVIIVWSDPRGGAPDIYAQHLNSAGAPLWTVNGGALCVAPETQSNPIAVEDGLGGAWVAWTDFRNGIDDIFARHINAAGVPEGAATGLAICTATGVQNELRIASDEAGGTIIAWQDARGGSNHDIYAQRLSLAGSMLWTANGTPACNEASHQEYPDVASDGAGGAIFVWKDWRSYPNLVSLFAQRLNAAGQPQWTPDGNFMGDSDKAYALRPVIMSDGEGESIIAWDAAHFNAQIGDREEQLLVQRLDANGTPDWQLPGVELRGRSPYPGDGGVGVSSLVSDGWGGVIVGWTDNWYWQASDVRVGHVSPGGVATDVTPTRGPSLMAVDVYPNPFSGSAKLAVELGKPSRVDVDVFDVAGRKVRSFAQAEGSLTHVIDIDDRDDAGNILASGVYFCRVRAATGTVTRKIVITR